MTALAQDQVRQRVLDICACVFEVDVVPEHLGFFDVGGDSLLAMKVLGRVGDAVGAELSLMTLYESNSLAEFADAVVALCHETKAPARESAALDHRASIGQEGMFDGAQGGRTSIITSVAFRVCGELDEKRLRRAISCVTEAHESLRTALRRVGDAVHRVVAQTIATPLIVDTADGLEDDIAWIKGWLTPFDLAVAPLFRVVWRRRASGKDVLLVVFDHIIADGWSETIFCEELELAYAQAHDPDFRLPAEQISFGAWAQWQRDRLTGPHLTSVVESWRALLGDDPAVLGTALPGYRAESDPIAAGIVNFTIDEATTAQVRELSRSLGVTIYATLLAAFAGAVSRATGSPRLVFQTSSANRRLASHERIIGPLFTQVPIVLDLAGANGLTDAVRRAHAAVTQANDLGELPYRMLYELVWPGREYGRPELPIFYFALNAKLDGPALAGADVSPIEYDWPQIPYGVETWLVESKNTVKGTIRWPVGRLDDQVCQQLVRGFLSALA